jgi:hypothetical protein
MERPQRERQTLGLLQLEMRIVIDPIRQEREDDPREDPRGRTSGQLADEQRDAGTRHDESR